MDILLEKLKHVDDNTGWNEWNQKEIYQLLKLYYTICKKESHIFNLIYRYHGGDSWEDIFRDYDETYLENKTSGVKVAINELKDIMKQN